MGRVDYEKREKEQYDKKEEKVKGEEKQGRAIK